MLDLKDKVIFITGGALGIGASSVRLFLEDNVKHVAIVDVSETAGKDLEADLNSKYGGRVQFIKCDVTNVDELSAAYKKVFDEYGYIDVVVNNAGVMNENSSSYRKAIDINYKALVSSTYIARDLMRKDQSGKGGLILNIASVAAVLKAPYIPVYYSTKSAILQFSNCLGSEMQYERTSVKIVALCIGVTRTGIIRNSNVPYDEDLHEEFLNYMKSFYIQSVESAGKAIVETCKLAENGTTWLSKDDKPLKDITWAVQKTYNFYEELLEQ